MPRLPQVLKVLTLPNPLLLRQAQKVVFPLTPEVQDNIADMKYTIKYIGERVGLAAPQVGINKQIMMCRVPANLHPRYKDIADEDQEPMPWTTIVNPVMIPLTAAMESGWESCLSVLNVQGRVWRYTGIKCNYQNEQGEYKTIIAKKFLARLLQHEGDHLEGTLFPMKVQSLDDLRSETVPHIPFSHMKDLELEYQAAIIELLGAKVYYDYAVS